MTGGVNYKFKVRASNIYGYGDFSSEFIVEASDMPGKPPIPTVNLVATNIAISWQAPASHFAVIDSYEILFKKVDDTFVEELNYCDGSLNLILNSLSCSIPMLDVETLTELSTDTLI